MAFVTPFLMGGLSEIQRQRQETDDITGKVVDTVAPYILDKIFSAEKLSEKQNKLFNGYSNRYGSNFAQVIAKANLLESGDEKEADALIKNYFGTDDLGSIKKMIDEKAKDAKSFQKLFGYNPITARQKSIKDKKEFVNELFSDRANLKKLMIDPDQKRTGISGFLFGDTLTKENIPGAISRVAEATQLPTTDTGAPSQDISSYLGIKPMGELSFTELQKRSDTASRQRVQNIMRNAQDAFDRRKIYANQYQISKEFKTEYENLKKEFEKANPGRAYPLSKVDYAFKKFLPSYIETFEGISYYPTVPTTAKTVEQPVVKTEKPAAPISKFKTQVTAKPGTPKFRLEVQDRVNEMQKTMSGIEPDQLVAFANQRIADLEKNASSTYDPSQDIEVIKATTRLQLQQLRVDPRTYGY